MKHVLVIDESPLLREYLRKKLSENRIEASIAINGLDAMSKMRTIMPDLIIIDYHLSRQSCLEVLEEKRRNPNTAGIPVIVTAQKIDQDRIIELLNYNVKKVFTKPIRIDALFNTLAELMGIQFKLDSTPCILEVHVNENIIFVEIAKGLNWEKLDILKYKIEELVELYDIRKPKIIVMLSDLELSFPDAPNLQKLLDAVREASGTKNANIRILTNNEFTRKFVQGHKEYEGMGVVSNLQYALDGLLSELDGKMEYGEDKARIIGDRILSSDGESITGTVQLRFEGEGRKNREIESFKELGTDIKIAVVDDDFVIQELLKTAFQEIGAKVSTYPDGEDFLAIVEKEDFDLVFLDLLMPKVDGFAVLEELQTRGIERKVIVLSAVTRRDAVVKAFQSGVKSYLVKPLKPEAILRKAVEILGPNF